MERVLGENAGFSNPQWSNLWRGDMAGLLNCGKNKRIGQLLPLFGKEERRLGYMTTTDLACFSVHTKSYGRVCKTSYDWRERVR